MSYRVYKLLAKSTLAAFSEGAHTYFLKWASKWCAIPVDCRITAASMDHNSLDVSYYKEWWIAEFAETGCIAFAKDRNAIEGLSTLLFTADGVRNTDLTQGVLRSAMTEYMSMFVSQYIDSIASSSNLPGYLVKKGTGSVILKLQFKDFELTLILSGDMVPASVTEVTHNQAKPRSRFAPLVSRKVNISVIAGQAQLEIGMLQTLNVGDVVRLNTHLSGPLEIYVDKTLMGKGYLGAVENSKAIQIKA